MLVGAASDEAPACFFFRIEPAAMTARLVTMGRTCYKAWRVHSPFFFFIDHLYFCGTYPSHLRQSGEAIDDPHQA
jgi:hypothetical protein